MKESEVSLAVSTSPPTVVLLETPLAVRILPVGDKQQRTPDSPLEPAGLASPRSQIHSTFQAGDRLTSVLAPRSVVIAVVQRGVWGEVKMAFKGQPPSCAARGADSARGPFPTSQFPSATATELISINSFAKVEIWAYRRTNSAIEIPVTSPHFPAA